MSKSDYERGYQDGKDQAEGKMGSFEGLIGEVVADPFVSVLCPDYIAGKEDALADATKGRD